MESRASIAPGLPRTNPTISYWQDPPDSISDHRTTSDLPLNADIVIIGSGISGSSIAYNILTQKPEKKVVVLEARQACSGASGRNGGHTKGASYRTFLENVKIIGEEEAVRIARLEYSCMRRVHAFAREHGIECESRELDTVDVFYDQGQWDNAIKAIESMRRVLGEDDPVAKYQTYSAKDSQAKFLVSGVFGSVTYPAGSLSAYKFVIGVLRLALKKGLNLQTNTPVTNLAFTEENNQGRWGVQTQRGTIIAKELVLASNGYTAELYSQLLGTICPLRGQVTAHRPGTGMPQTGLSTTYSFIYKQGFEYMISRPQGSNFAGDIIIGGGLTKAAHDGFYEYGNTDDTSLDPDISGYLLNTTSRYFGSSWGEDASEGRIRKEWTGVMGYSSDGYPLVGEVPGEKGLFISASFQGHGMVQCFLCATALTDIMLDKDGPELDSWFPRAFKISKARLSLPFNGKVAHVPVNRNENM